MGKQGFDSRTALANALNTSGKAKAAPPKKEVVKEVPVAKKKAEKTPDLDLPPKTKKDLEEDQRRYLEQKEAEKKQFFAAEQARKLAGAKGADQEVTYVEDKDTRKPKAVSDISHYWKKDLGLLPFMPTDNVQELEVPEELDVSLRLLYLQTLNDQLEQLLRMRFHVFWSQCIFDSAVSRLVDSYLRFCLRSHDLPEGQADAAPLSMEEVTVSKDVSRRMFQLLVRLSRPQESPHEFLSHDKFAQVIHEHQLFDVPKIIDVCVFYGDANRNAVTKIVHSVFKHQPLFKEEFNSVVQHMLDGLLQCCAPLQLAAHGGKLNSQELSVSECKSFLPDMLSCFNAIFCFFPEDCVETLMGGSLKVNSAATESLPTLPLADLMVILHDAITTLRDKEDDGRAEMDSIVKLLSRLLSCVLGFRMAPRYGADAFGDLVAWVTEHAERTKLLEDLSRNGLDNVAMEWIASGLVDDAQLDYLDTLCGAPLLPKEARHRRGAAPPRPPRKAETGGSSASASQPSQPQSGQPAASSNDRAKIREVREVVGFDYGEGFILQCLLHYGGSVPQVVGGILDGSLPPQITALPIGMGIGADSISSVAEATPQPSLSAADKELILTQADRVDASSDVEVEHYNDDFDDEEAVGMPRLAAGVASDWEDKSEEEEQGSSDGDEPRWSNDRMHGGRLKGKGKGKGKSYGPTQGQTVQARRKEANKAQVANHNRRDAAMRKMARGL